MSPGSADGTPPPPAGKLRPPVGLKASDGTSDPGNTSMVSAGEPSLIVASETAESPAREPERGVLEFPDGSYVPRSTVVRLRAQLRDERAAFLRETQHLRQQLLRIELARERQRQDAAKARAAVAAAQMQSGAGSPRAGGSRSNSPTTQPSPLDVASLSFTARGGAASDVPVFDAVYKESPSVAAQQVRMDDIAKALDKVEIGKELKDEMQLEVAAAKKAHESELQKLTSRHGAEVTALKRDVAKIRNIMKVDHESATMRIERATQAAEAKAALAVEATVTECATLKKLLSEEREKTTTLQAELQEWRRQGAKQLQTIESLQEERADLSQQVQTMHNALDALASEQARAHWARVTAKEDQVGSIAAARGQQQMLGGSRSPRLRGNTLTLSPTGTRPVSPTGSGSHRSSENASDSVLSPAPPALSPAKAHGRSFLSSTASVAAASANPSGSGKGQLAPGSTAAAAAPRKPSRATPRDPLAIVPEAAVIG